MPPDEAPQGDAPAASPEAAPPPLDIPVTQPGTAHNAPVTSGMPTEVQELVDAALGRPGGPIAFKRPPEPAPEPEAAPVPEGGEPEPEGDPREVRWAELAEQERALRQQQRAFDFRRREFESQKQEPTAQAAQTRDQRIESFRQDPIGYLQREYGTDLPTLADMVTGIAPEGTGDMTSAEVSQLRAELGAVKNKLESYETQQTQAQQQYQYQMAHTNLVEGLREAEATYPLLNAALGPEQAATAILQGVHQSYISEENFKTADQVAAELEAHLQSVGERLQAARNPKPADPAPPVGQPLTPTQPQPQPRLTNQSTASPQTVPRPRSRQDEVEAAAALLRFTEGQ